MEYFELTSEEMMSRLTNKPTDLLEPILDELVFYHNHTEEIDVDLTKLEISVNNGLVIGGCNAHPYLAWRLTNYVVKVAKSSMGFWENHPDAWIPVIRAALEKLGERGTLTIINGEVIAVNALGAKLGSNLNFLEDMFSTATRSVTQSGKLVTLTGFQVSPMWTFVRLLPIGNSLKKHHIGFQMEANYLFKKSFRRATFAMYMRDIKRQTDMSLYEWANISGLLFNSQATDFYPAFARKFERDKRSIGLREMISQTESTLKKVDVYAETHWKQATLLRFKNFGVSEKSLRKAAAEFEYGTTVDYCVSLLPPLKKFSLDRQLVAENQIAKHLKGTK